MDTVVSTVLAGLLSGSVLAVVLGFLTRRKLETISAEVSHAFDRIRRKEAWQEDALREILGPAVLQFDRTKRAFQRWDKENPYLEVHVVKAGNEAVLQLLLAKGYLLPPHLLGDAADLVEHYDRWLEEFEKWRVKATVAGPSHIFVGPDGFPFPRHAEKRFRATFAKLRKELYDFTGPSQLETPPARAEAGPPQDT